MELSEAIDVLKNKIGDYVIAEYCNNCWHKKDCTDDCNYLLSIYTVLQTLEELQEENEKLKDGNKILENCKYVNILEIEKSKAEEKERWKNKIKEKIEEIKAGTETCYGRIKYQEGKIAVLEELLKGE